MKPLLSYYGGDQRMAPYILPYVEQIPHTVWVEVFGGGAAMTFAKPEPRVRDKSKYREVINDIRDDITTFYRVAREHSDQLLHYLAHTPYGQSDHRKAQEICKNPGQYSDVDLAWAVFLNCNQSFAKTMGRGWGTSVCSENNASTWSKRIDRLPLQLERIKDAYISNEDALRCIERWDSPQTLFYLDPGYPGTDCGHYEALSEAQFTDLVDLLEECQGSFILHCYPYKGIPGHWHKVEIQTTCHASGKGRVRTDRTRKATAEELGDRKRIECLWICERSHAMREELSFARYRQASLFDGGVA